MLAGAGKSHKGGVQQSCSERGGPRPSCDLSCFMLPCVTVKLLLAGSKSTNYSTRFIPPGGLLIQAQIRFFITSVIISPAFISCLFLGMNAVPPRFCASVPFARPVFWEAAGCLLSICAVSGWIPKMFSCDESQNCRIQPLGESSDSPSNPPHTHNLFSSFWPQ